jgi:hypothetical protein
MDELAAAAAVLAMDYGSDEEEFSGQRSLSATEVVTDAGAGCV